MYLSDKDLTKYDIILDMAVSRVYNSYYLKKIEVVNELISHYNTAKNINKS